MRRALVVLAKSPVAGRSKTRLTPPCPPEQACALAEAALADTLRAVASADVERRVLVLDGTPGPWLPAGFEVIAQRSAELDERLASAYADVLGDTEGPTLLIGMDTPQLTADLLDAAMAVLAARPGGAVLGDAADGGWWAIGLHRADAGVFTGVAMSRADTSLLQRHRLRSRGLAVADLPVLRDVDRWDDAVAVAALCPADSSFARAMAAQPGHGGAARRAAS